MLAATLMDMRGGSRRRRRRNGGVVVRILGRRRCSITRPPRVAKALEEDAETQTKIIARMRPSEAAATMEK